MKNKENNREHGLLVVKYISVALVCIIWLGRTPGAGAASPGLLVNLGSSTDDLINSLRVGETQLH